ncbi:hypothetical protein CEXT_684571 [Caerostris extrusa]|uniref:Uncharacterized protein n=1 Tax=Caerostris extrusa TaxID=172846 RepID=A0AAV4XZ84_CAEEX|nr:hypothetical protein CEXT_684571 [Caerostris extrusa]
MLLETCLKKKNKIFTPRKRDSLEFGGSSFYSLYATCVWREAKAQGAFYPTCFWRQSVKQNDKYLKRLEHSLWGVVRKPSTIVLTKTKLYLQTSFISHT